MLIRRSPKVLAQKRSITPLQLILAHRSIRLAPQHQSPAGQNQRGGISMTDLIFKLWRDDQGQDILEYAVMPAVILVIVVGTIRLIGSNANTVFSSAASSIQ